MIVEDVEEAEEAEELSPKRTVPWIVIGIILVVLGGHVMVTNGVVVARILGISEYIIGILTGLGTTLPEIAVGAVAAKRGDEGISVGAILGSNITDPVFSLGIGALFVDVVVTNTSSMVLSMRYMLLVSLIVIGLFYWRGGIDKKAGVLCILLYIPSFFLL